MVLEIKRSTAPTVSRGFHIAREDLGAGDAYVVHRGKATWPMGGGITAISVAELLGRLTKA